MSDAPAVWSFDAIGTRWTIETAAPLPPSLRARIVAIIERFDADWSRFRPDSLVSRLAERGGEHPAPPDAEEMLALYAELDAATSGAVNPLVGDALARLGYDARLSLAPRGIRPAPSRWRRLLHWGGGTLRLDSAALIDVGALGKGRLVDLVMAELSVRLADDDVNPTGARRDIVVDAGGDLAVRGRPQRVGLEHPFDPRQALGVIELQDAALCASATNRRAWGDGLHHVLDARTGAPVHAYAATWAVAPTAMTADAVATALFFEGGAAFAAEREAEWVRMRTDGRVEWSPGCRAELFR